MKILKGFFKTILGLILFLLLIVVIIFAMFYNGKKMPKHHKTYDNSLSLQEMVAKSIDDFFDYPDKELDIGFPIEYINKTIYDKLYSNREDLINSNTSQNNNNKKQTKLDKIPTINRKIFRNEEAAKWTEIRDIWVELDKDLFTINIGVDLKFSKNSKIRFFKTRVSAQFKVFIESDNIIYDFRKVKLGNISINKDKGLGKFIRNKFPELDETVKDFFNSNIFKEIKSDTPNEKYTYVASINKMIDFLTKDNLELKNILTTLNDIRIGNNLVNESIITKEKINIHFNTNKLKDDQNKVPKTINLNSDEVDILNKKKTMNVLLSNLSYDRKNKLHTSFTLKELNNLSEYYLKNEALKNKEVNFLGRKIFINSEAPKLVVLNDKLYFLVKLTLTKEGSKGRFETVLCIQNKQAFLEENSDLSFEMGKISIGEVSIDESSTQNVLNKFVSNKASKDNKIAINNISSQYLKSMEKDNGVKFEGYELYNLGNDEYAFKLNFVGVDTRKQETIKAIRTVYRDALEKSLGVIKDIKIKEELNSYITKIKREEGTKDSDLAKTISNIKTKLTTKEQTVFANKLLTSIQEELDLVYKDKNYYVYDIIINGYNSI